MVELPFFETLPPGDDTGVGIVSHAGSMICCAGWRQAAHPLAYGV
jgi:hypothetical protein